MCRPSDGPILDPISAHFSKDNLDLSISATFSSAFRCHCLQTTQHLRSHTIFYTFPFILNTALSNLLAHIFSTSSSTHVWPTSHIYGLFFDYQSHCQHLQEWLKGHILSVLPLQLKCKSKLWSVFCIWCLCFFRTSGNTWVTRRIICNIFHP